MVKSLKDFCGNTDAATGRVEFEILHKRDLESFPTQCYVCFTYFPTRNIHYRNKLWCASGGESGDETEAYSKPKPTENRGLFLIRYLRVRVREREPPRFKANSSLRRRSGDSGHQSSALDDTQRSEDPTTKLPYSITVFIFFES